MKDIHRHSNKFTSIKIAIFLLFAMVMGLLQGCGQETTTADLQHIQLSSIPGYYLICPANFCNFTPNENPPIYPVSADDLFSAWNMMMSHQIDVRVLGSVPERGQYDYEQRTLVFGFPDLITVQFISLSDSTSTLAVYSRSDYGFYDFGTNKRRLQSWMKQLNQAVIAVSALPPAPADTTDDSSDELAPKPLPDNIVNPAATSS